MKRSKRTRKHKFRVIKNDRDITINIYMDYFLAATQIEKSNTLLSEIVSHMYIPPGYSIVIGGKVTKDFDIPIGNLTSGKNLKIVLKKVVQLSPKTIPVEIVLNNNSYSLSKKSDETINDILKDFIPGFDPNLYHIIIKGVQVDIHKSLEDFSVGVAPVKIFVVGVAQGAGGGGKSVSSGKLPQKAGKKVYGTLKITYWVISKLKSRRQVNNKNKDKILKEFIEDIGIMNHLSNPNIECKCTKTGDNIDINQTLEYIVKKCPDITVTAIQSSTTPKAAPIKASVVPKATPIQSPKKVTVKYVYYDSVRGRNLKRQKTIKDNETINTFLKKLPDSLHGNDVFCGDRITVVPKDLTIRKALDLCKFSKDLWLVSPGTVPKPAPKPVPKPVPKPAITKMDSVTRKEFREGLERIQGKENITEKELRQGGEIDGIPYWGIKKKRGITTRLENEGVIEVTGYVPRGKKTGSDLVTREDMSQGEIIKIRSTGVSEGGVQKCRRHKTKESCVSKFEGCIWDSAKNICGVDELYGSDLERDGLYLRAKKDSDNSFVLVIPPIISRTIDPEYPGFYKNTQKFFEENNIYFFQNDIAVKYSKKLLFEYVKFLHNDVLLSKFISPPSIMNAIRTNKLQLIQPRYIEDVSQDIRNEVIEYLKEYEDNIDNIIQLLKKHWPNVFFEGDDIIRSELDEFAKKSKDVSDLDAFIVTYKFRVYPGELINKLFQMDFRSSIPNNCLIEEVNKKRINSSSYIMYHGTSLEVWRKIRESLLNLRDADDPEWRWNFGDYIPPNCTELGKPPTKKPCQLFGSGLILKAPKKPGKAFAHLGGDPLPVAHGGLFGVGLYVTRSVNKAIAYARQSFQQKYNPGVVLRLEIAPGDLHRPTNVDDCQTWIAENPTLSSSYVHPRMCIGYQQGKENYEEFTIPYFEGWRVLRIMGLVGIDEGKQKKTDDMIDKNKIDEERYPPPLAVVRQKSIDKLKSPPK
jgi:hypothetical protein